MVKVGRIYRGQERYSESEVLLTEWYARLVALLGPTHDRTKTIGESLAGLYEAWGKPEKAAEWRTKLAAEQDTVTKD